MTHVSSGIQDVSCNRESTGLENSIIPLLQEYLLTKNMDLRYVIEDITSLSLSEGSLLRKPHYAYCDFEPEVVFHFMKIPRKILVEGKRFKSIW